MAKTILKRLGLLIVTLLLVTVLAFVAFSILPGDPTTAILGVDATDEQIAVLRRFSFACSVIVKSDGLAR